MTPDRWDEILKKIEEMFKVEDRYEEDLDPGIAEVIEFITPQGKLKASFHRQPKVLGKKTLYSRRGGGDVHVDYKYSETDEVYFMTVNRWNEDTQSWVNVEADSLF